MLYIISFALFYISSLFVSERVCFNLYASNSKKITWSLSLFLLLFFNLFILFIVLDFIMYIISENFRLFLKVLSTLFLLLFYIFHSWNIFKSFWVFLFLFDWNCFWFNLILHFRWLFERSLIIVWSEINKKLTVFWYHPDRSRSIYHWRSPLTS